MAIPNFLICVGWGGIHIVGNGDLCAEKFARTIGGQVVCGREGPHEQKSKFILIVGPRGVRALPLAAGIIVGGHYKWHFFLFSLSLQLIANSPRRGCRRNSN